MTSSAAPGPASERLRFLRRAVELMLTARELDSALVTWQRQGLIPAYAPMRGQEAAQVGSALAADPARDFLFPTYRELGAAVAFGVDLAGYLENHSGTWHGGSHDPVANRFAPIQSVVGATALHAVGWALGRRKDGADGVAIAYFGDGASSQGDVHEAMNFAAVFRAPAVFLVQNNRWALSVPLDRQVAGGSVAARAAGYGIAGVQVDGDDVEAVHEATAEAVAEARATGRPAVVEAMTYRRGPHATSDDPGRYRTLEEERAAGEDPIDRARRALVEAGGAQEDWFAETGARIAERIERLRDGVAGGAPRPGTELFDFVFQEPTPQLRAQAAAWREESEHV